LKLQVTYIIFYFNRNYGAHEQAISESKCELEKPSLEVGHASNSLSTNSNSGLLFLPCCQTWFSQFQSFALAKKGTYSFHDLNFDL